MKWKKKASRCIIHRQKTRNKKFYENGTYEKHLYNLFFCPIPIFITKDSNYPYIHRYPIVSWYDWHINCIYIRIEIELCFSLVKTIVSCCCLWICKAYLRYSINLTNHNKFHQHNVHVYKYWRISKLLLKNYYRDFI